MSDSDQIQYRMRSKTYTSDDILYKLPQLIDIHILSQEQNDILTEYIHKIELLHWLQERKFNLSRVDTNDSPYIASEVESQIEELEDKILDLCDCLHSFSVEHATTMKQLLDIGRPAFEKWQEEEDRKILEEWRKPRHSSAKCKQSTTLEKQSHIAPAPTVAESQISTKSRISDFLFSAGGILYYIIILLIATIPIVMIGLPFWIDLILLGIMLFIPATSAIFWIWGLIATIIGPQDVWAVAYYILFAIMFLPFFIKLFKK